MVRGKAALIQNGGAPPTFVDVDYAPLRPNEVRIRVVATSVCHTDVAWADGVLFDEFPTILGHESAGIVEEIGTGVTRVLPGDRVAVALALHCGHCRYCESGRPMLCGQRLTDPGRITCEGRAVVQGFGTAGFAQWAIVTETAAIPIPAHLPMAVASVMGCATSTGLGAVFNIAQVEYGSRVLVLGAGGIGLNVIMGCVVAGAERIVVADPNVARREQARSFGATDACEATVEALHEVEPNGFEYVFECAGFAQSMETGIAMTERGGTVTLIGAPPPDVEIRINALDFVPSQRRILGCLTGNVRPNVDFDRFFRLFARGALPLDRLITRQLPFEQLAKAFDDNRHGRGIRTVMQISEE